MVWNMSRLWTKFMQASVTQRLSSAAIPWIVNSLEAFQVCFQNSHRLLFTFQLSLTLTSQPMQSRRRVKTCFIKCRSTAIPSIHSSVAQPKFQEMRNRLRGSIVFSRRMLRPNRLFDDQGLVFPQSSFERSGASVILSCLFL